MTSSSLPASWMRCSLSDAIDYGSTEKAEPSVIPEDGWVLELEDIEKDTSKVLTRAVFSERKSKSTKNRFRSGDILYGKLRPYLNKVIRAESHGFCSTEILPLRPSSAICADYLFHWLKSPAFLEYVGEVSHGLNMPRLGTEAGRKAPLVLAPLNEQRRIAYKLDTVLSRVDACRERLDRIPAILKRFRQSVLAAATSGKLTKDWREAGRRGLEWKRALLGEVADSRLGKMLDKAKNKGDLLPYLRNINVRWFGFDLSEVQHIRVSDREASELTLKPGDVLVCEGGEPGRCAIWQDAGSAFVYQKALHRVRVGPRLLPEWLCYCLKDAADDGRLSELFSGTTIRHLTGISLARFELPLPPIDEQFEIVRRVGSLFARSEELMAVYATANAKVASLTPSLLSKAFKGELVPQDPNDEPASVLLKRIRAERTTSTSMSRRSKGGRRARIGKKLEVAMLNRTEIDGKHLSTILRERGPLTSEALWSASQLGIDDFYDQLKDEEARGLLVERRGDSATAPRMLEAAA